METISAEEEEKNNKTAIAMDTEAPTWKEKKKLLEMEQKALQNELEGLKAWINEIENMDEQQLEEYLRNRSEDLKTIMIEKNTPSPRVQRPRKSRNSGIMSTVWKFHKENGQVCSNSFRKNA